jgi:hypothetical protein
VAGGIFSSGEYSIPAVFLCYNFCIIVINNCMDPIIKPTAAPLPAPVRYGDTFSHKGWLTSDSFFKRAFAVLGYNLVAALILYIPLMAIMFGLMGSFMYRMGSAMQQPSFDQQQQMMHTQQQMPKLNINEICNGALASMTFTDGKAADAFVADCVAGKHPEVVEQFKIQMMQGMDGGAGMETGVVDPAAI